MVLSLSIHSPPATAMKEKKKFKFKSKTQIPAAFQTRSQPNNVGYKSTYVAGSVVSTNMGHAEMNSSGAAQRTTCTQRSRAMQEKYSGPKPGLSSVPQRARGLK
ncbi:hypothetical protein R3P38DRAFT_3182993 [Favolaschia claudopus]|uniref:Uncharacterized protein n=1 Tax=Favolaschia claudopus TaxID=2862362 RepID=A0AAW0CDN4_9AGAR